MNKIIVTIVLFALSLFTISLRAEEPQEPTMEKNAVVQWVMEHANVDISPAAAIRIVDYAYWHSYRFGLDPMFVIALMRLESGFNSKAVSSEGAKGLMQVLTRVHKKDLAGRNIYDTTVNVEMGTKILNNCMEVNKGNKRKALDCYSGGAGVKYLRTILKYEKELRRHVLFALFDKQETVLAQR